MPQFKRPCTARAPPVPPDACGPPFMTAASPASPRQTAPTASTASAAPVTARPLIVRLCNQVGDVVLSVPALRLLQAHGHALHIVGKRWAAALLRAEGWPCHAYPDGKRARAGMLRSLARELAAADPGFARRPNILLMPNSLSSALEARLGGLKPAGYARDGRGWLLARTEQPGPGRHELQDHFDLACSFLGLQPRPEPPPHIALAIPPAAQAAARALLAERGVPVRYLVVVPFAAGVVDKRDKRWPGFAELTRELSAQGHTLIACPGPGEDEALRRDHPGVIALPGVGLDVYAALLQAAAAVVSNDTGPAHMAAAVGAPLISVLGPTRPEQWGPWGPTVRIVTRHPDWPSVAEVHAALREWLQASGPVPDPRAER